MRLTNIKEIHATTVYSMKEDMKKKKGGGDTWLYYNLNEKGYLSKISNVFYGDSSAKRGGNRGHVSRMLLFSKLILVKN